MLQIICFVLQTLFCFSTTPANSWRIKVLCDSSSLALNLRKGKEKISEAFWKPYWLNDWTSQTPNTDKKPLEARCFSSLQSSLWTFPGSAIARPLALFESCVSCPLAYLLFLALSSRFVSRIYPRLNLSIFSKLCLSCAPAASVLTTSGCQTPGSQILSIALRVAVSPPSLCPIMFKFLFIILICQSTLRV